MQIRQLNFVCQFWRMRMSKVVAIHQPNFFPWLGYFDKIAKSDIFIFLDHVQYPKTGGSWSNRVKLMSRDTGQWITAPIERNFHGVRSINQIVFKEGNGWRDNFVKWLQINYSGAPFFKETYEFISPLILDTEDNMAKYDIRAISAIASHIGLSNKMFLLSSDVDVNGQATEMLINLVEATNCQIYLCGGGSAGYQDDNMFANAGIELQYQNFQHPIYPQVGRQGFVPGLSIVDALMSVGAKQVHQWFTEEVTS